MDKYGAAAAAPLFVAFGVHLKCIEVGCAEDVTIKRHRLCARHYAMRRRFVPRATRVPVTVNTPMSAPFSRRDVCGNADCIRDMYANGYCRSHYMHEWRRGAFKHEPRPLLARDCTDESSCASVSSASSTHSVTMSCDEMSMDGTSGTAENWCAAGYTAPAPESGSASLSCLPLAHASNNDAAK